MIRAVDFEAFSSQCDFLDTEAEVNGGYGCTHPEQEIREEEKGKRHGCCFCFSCPLGIGAEQEDLSDGGDKIDWDGLCSDGIVPEDEILLVASGDDATEEERTALCHYESFLHRYG